MSGIILLIILTTWFFIVKKISGMCVSVVNDKRKRDISYVVIFSLVFIAPVTDEIVGGFQFRELCEKGSSPVYSDVEVEGRSLSWLGYPRKGVEGTILPVEEKFIFWVDKDTGSKLINYKEYYASGGILSRTIKFNGMNRPYTFQGVCGAKEEMRIIKEKFNVKTIYK